MDFGKFFGDLFTDQMKGPVPNQNPALMGQKNTPGEIPQSQGFNRTYNDPFANQSMFEEVKARQNASTPMQQTPLGGTSGGAADLLSRIGLGGIVGGGKTTPLPGQIVEKNYSSCLTHMQTYQGKNVIITGGTGAIGSKVAKKLLKAGAKVILIVKDPTKVEQALNIKDPRIKSGYNYQYVTLNLGEPHQMEKKFRQALSLLDGRLDHLFLCHGIINNESIIETNMLEWDKLMNINVRASFQLSSLAVPFLKLHKGSITVLSSNAGETPQPGQIIFSTSMAMLNMFVKTTALETSFHGVRINAVAPGVTISNSRMKKESMNLTEQQNRNFLLESAQDVPLMNLLNQPGDVARSMLFLGSEEASFITGEILVMDGAQSLTSNNYPDYIKSLSQINN